MPKLQVQPNDSLWFVSFPMHILHLISAVFELVVFFNQFRIAKIYFQLQ
jgi:hypothetical protein